MDKKKEYKEMEKLKNAKLRSYTVDDFKQYWTYEDDYSYKRARVVNSLYIVVYSSWHKRLLARVFFLEEKMKYKKIIRKLVEVQRQVAGISVKLSRLIYNSTFYGLKVYPGDYPDKEWKIVRANNTQLYRLYDTWNGREIVGFEKYNDPVKFLKKSIHKYSAFEYLPEEKQEHNYMFEYLLKYEKHPQIEMLAKIGLYQIIDNLSGVRWSKKGPAMLGITKPEIEYLKEIGFNLTDYRKIREECLKYHFTPKEAKLLYQLKEREIPTVNVARTVRYIADRNIDCSLYDDLMQMKNELGLPDERKYLYPDDFHKTHDELAKRIKIKKSLEVKKKIEQRKKEAESYKISKNGLMIIPLLGPEELIDEGKALKHCVGGYASRVADGKCLIFSVRKSDEASKRLATIELRGKKVIQVRAYKNREPTMEVSNFVRNWEKHFHLEGY